MRQTRMWLAATLALCSGRVTCVPTLRIQPSVHDSPQSVRGAQAEPMKVAVTGAGLGSF